MAYTRPPSIISTGTGLAQTPNWNTPSGIVPVNLAAVTASSTTLGAVKIGANISVTPDGVISTAGGGGTCEPWDVELAANGSTLYQINNFDSMYYRNGDLVVCMFNIEITGTPAGHSTKKLSIVNLPYSGAGSTPLGAVVISYFCNMNDNIDYVSGTVPGGTTQCELWYSSEQKKSLIPMLGSTVKVSSKLIGTITYFTQD